MTSCILVSPLNIVTVHHEAYYRNILSGLKRGSCAILHNGHPTTEDVGRRTQVEEI
jgi:hypothetical protein